MKIKQSIGLLMICLMLTSCIPTEEIEELGIITARGIDYLEEHQLQTTLIIFQFEAQSQNFTKIVSGTGETVKEAVQDANYESNFKLVPGKIQLEIYGKDTAERGIFPFIDSLHRNATIPDSMYLAISDTNASELLTVQEEDISMNIGQFLHGVIEKTGTDHKFPRVTLKDFLKDFNDIGKDPILPLFQVQGDIPKLTDIAIFKNDQYVDRLPADNINYLNMFNHTVDDATLALDLPMEPFKDYIKQTENIYQKEQVVHTSFDLFQGKSYTTLVDRNRLQFKTEITLDLGLIGISEKLSIKNKRILQLLEREIEKAVQSRYEKILKQLQDVNADSFGFGCIFFEKERKKEPSIDEWRRLFPQIDVDFEVDANIIRHGTIE